MHRTPQGVLCRLLLCIGDASFFKLLMTEKTLHREVSLTERLALDLINSDDRREQTSLLLDEHLPELAAEIESNLIAQDARLLYEIFTEQHHPKVRVIVRLKKFEHELLIHLDSKNAMFVIGSERSGDFANSAITVANILRTQLLKLKVS